MWKGLNDLISDYFGKITLADLALPDQAGNDYVI
jgi:Rrf2 family iron-sulfur cluster assembly transcriptional regulator